MAGQICSTTKVTQGRSITKPQVYVEEMCPEEEVGGNLRSPDWGTSKEEGQSLQPDQFFYPHEFVRFTLVTSLVYFTQ